MYYYLRIEVINYISYCCAVVQPLDVPVTDNSFLFRWDIQSAQMCIK